MTMGIRAKLVLLLTAVALVPLLAALLVIVVGGAKLRVQTVEQSLLAVARSEAQTLRSWLLSDLRQLQAVLEQPWLVAELERRDEVLPRGEIVSLDNTWPTLPASNPRLRSVLEGPGADALRVLQKANEHLAEVFITDRHGQLVAATNRTTDFYQADEEWWQGAHDEGRGSVYIPPVSYDRSSGVWSIDICVPIFARDAASPSGDEGGGRAIVGIGKAVVDLGRWLGGLRRLAGVLQALPTLVNRDGSILYRKNFDPLEHRAEEWSGPITEGRTSGHRVTAGGEIQAYVPISLDREEVGAEIEMPWWTLILYMPESEALGAMYRLSVAGLAIGIVGVVLLFLAGVYLVDRNITRRVLQIAAAARRVAQGDLSARVQSRRGAGRPSNRDEIDELSVGFNRMVESVEQSLRQLSAANDLKRKFLQVASHELRTPISYIVGSARLLARSTDPARLSEALRSVGAKAERLNAIVQSMFKLMPEGTLPRKPRYGEVRIGDFLEQLRREVGPFVEQRHQTLVLESSDLETFQADRERLLDVVENLVTNAIKFTPDGGEVRVTARRGSDDRVVFAVIDQGVGIPQEELAHLFEPFYSGGDVLQHSSGRSGFRKRGIGLGLAIVKYFVELHSGTVEATSGPAGSTFTISLPARPPTDSSAGGEGE